MNDSPAVQEERVLSAFISSLRTVDLRRKILFTLGIVILYRVGATVPSPGVNYPNVQQCIAQVSGGDSAQIYSLINLFSGGALLQLSVFAVGVMPYITASIIVQLLGVVIPRFEQLRKEGQAGQAKLTQYTATWRSRWRSCSPPRSWRSPPTAGCCRAARSTSSRARARA